MIPHISRRFAWLCVAALTLSLAGCDQERRDVPMEHRQTPSRDINEVMNDHTGEIMQIPGVSGLYMGELDDGTPCITVLVNAMTDEIRKKIPDRLEGHPVVVEEVGEIKPME